MIFILLPLYTLAMTLIPITVAALPTLYLLEINAGFLLKILSIPLGILLFGITFLGTASTLSHFSRGAIRPGKFPRDLKHPLYGGRRLWAMGWNLFFYFTPLYFVVLSFPKIRNLIFRVFGYRGDLGFNLAPDAWIRDLPVLELSKNSYIANRCTIGTNMCLADGTTLVDRVTLEEGSMLGHAALIGPGVKLGKESEVGVQAALGIRVRIKSKARVGIGCFLNHGVTVGEGAEIGPKSYLGIRCKVGDGIKVPGGSNIPAGVELLTQADCDRYYSSETARLKELALTAFNTLSLYEGAA